MASIPAEIWAPSVSPIRGACQPPNLKPLSVSSSGPPGAWATPSRVVKWSMWIRPAMVNSLQ